MHFLSASLVVTWALSLISCMVICQGSFHSSVRYNMKPYPCPPLLFIGNISIGMTFSLSMETCQQRQHKKKFKKKIMSIVFCHHCGLILSTAHNQCLRFQRQTTFARPLAHLGEGKNWPIADRRVPNNDPRNKSRTHFGSSILLLTFRERMYWFVFEYLWSWEFFHAWRGKDANDKCQQKLHSVSFHQHSKGVTPMSF